MDMASPVLFYVSGSAFVKSAYPKRLLHNWSLLRFIKIFNPIMLHFCQTPYGILRRKLCQAHGEGGGGMEHTDTREDVRGGNQT